MKRLTPQRSTCSSWPMPNRSSWFRVNWMADCQPGRLPIGQVPDANAVGVTEEQSGNLLRLGETVGFHPVEHMPHGYQQPAGDGDNGAGNRLQADEELTADHPDDFKVKYRYDPLNRLVEAEDHHEKLCYRYSHDEVGNRTVQQVGWPKDETGECKVDDYVTTSYLYDNANRLIAADSISYTWDNNGNLIYDGVYTYTYDMANRLVSVNDGQTILSTYAYNGLGDRLLQATSGVTMTYSLDIAAGLAQVLDDGEHLYLYGVGRMAQYSDTETEYFVADALGSVRMLLDEDGEAVLERFYQPYGEALDSSGDGASVYGFTGEMEDSSGLLP